MRIWLEALKENRYCTAIGVLCGGTYTCIAYYEYLYMNDIQERWHEYNQIFSVFASTASSTVSKTCTAASGIFGNVYTYTSRNKSTLTDNSFEMLADVLEQGKSAVIECIFIMFMKPVMLSFIKLALNYSLQSYLKRKWLVQYNNSQLGLKTCYPELAVQSREVIDNNSVRYINGLVERFSVILEIGIAASKLKGIYEKGQEVSETGSEFNLVNFTLQAMALYLITNTILSWMLGNATKLLMRANLVWRNQLTYSMDNSMQIEASQASTKESALLGRNLMAMSKFSVAQEVLETSVTTASLVLNFSLDFIILGKFLPSIVMQPTLFFKLQSVSHLINLLSSSLWLSFEKVSKAIDMAESGAKIVNFVHAIEEYARFMANRKDFIVERDNTKPLAVVGLNIEKRNNSRIAGEKDYLIKGLSRTFEQSRVYGIIGKTGCGKSTFFNILFDIYPFASGKVTIPAKENIVYVPQLPIFKVGQSWLDVLFYPLESHESAELGQDLSRKIDQWIRELQLNEIQERAEDNPLNWTSGLSGGEQQRVALLQAFIRIHIRRSFAPQDNIVLLLDESISKLDHDLQDIAFGLIRRIVQQENITALSIDHSSPQDLRDRYGDENILNLSNYTVAKEAEGKSH